MKGLDFGRLRHKVTIMRYQATKDPQGFDIQELVPLKSVWAEVRPTRGNERLEYFKTTNTQTYKVTMRNTDVTEKDVLKFRGKQYKINAIANPLMLDYYLELLCTEDLDHDVAEADDG